MNAKPSNQETKKRYGRPGLWWTMFRFRFALGRGKPLPAQKFLNRIPLPDAALDKAAFRAEEKALWGKYKDRDGNLRLVTWGNIYSSLLKTVIGIVVIACLFWGVYHLTAFYKENKELKSKTEPVRKFQPDIKTGKVFKLLDGNPMVVDIMPNPVFSDNTMYLPVPVLEGEKSHLFYLPDKKFAVELNSLNGGRMARTFMLADGKTLSYVYHPGEPGNPGKWLDRSQLAELKAEPKPEDIFFVPDGKELELRSDSWEKATPVVKIPGGTPLIFVHFAPAASLKSKFVWMQVRYATRPGKYQEGWVPAVSLVSPYLKERNEPGILEVTAGSGLAFRDAPPLNAARIAKVRTLKKGASVEFLAFAPLSDIFASDRVVIQVRYTHQPGENYTGWINAGKIKEKFIGKIETPGNVNGEE